MNVLIEYEFKEEEDRLNIKMSNWNRKALTFFYYVFFLTETFFIGFAFYLLIKFRGSYEILAFLGFVLIFTFIIYMILLNDMLPYNVVIEPERIILYYDRFFLGKKEKTEYKYKLKNLSSRKFIVKGQTRLEIFIKTTENKNLTILRFAYNINKKDFIRNIYFKIAEKLSIVYDDLPV